jgi:predicted ATPase
LLRRCFKGLAEPVGISQVLDESDAEGRFAASPGQAPPVSRDEEIELLLRRLRRAKDGEGWVVLLSGEPGIGKSRIAQTLLELLNADHYTRLRYYYSPHHQDSALYPAISQLMRAAGFQRSDTDAQRLSKLEMTLSQATSDLGDTVPLLAELLSVATGDGHPPLALTPQQRKETTLKALLRERRTGVEFRPAERLAHSTARPRPSCRA